MVTKSECEHDVGFYRPISGDGGDIVEECSKCGKRITTEGPKTVYAKQLQAQKQPEKKTEEPKEVTAYDEIERLGFVGKLYPDKTGIDEEGEFDFDPDKPKKKAVKKEAPKKSNKSYRY